MSAGGGHTANPAQRIDKWLWFARVAKTRTLAAGLVEGGKVRLNRRKVDKPSTIVKPGDTVTIVQSRALRVLKVVAFGNRRGPPKEAMGLYEELTQPQRTSKALRDERTPSFLNEPSLPARPPGAGRPTKKERRAIDRLKGTE